MSKRLRIAITAGDPAGIGPDLCCSLPQLAHTQLVVIGCQTTLQARAKQLGKTLSFRPYQADNWTPAQSEEVIVIDIPVQAKAQVGQAEPANAQQILALLDRAHQGCQQGEFAAMITAPINKAVINAAGISFSGHTEYLAQLCHVERVVMMLAYNELRVALATTHIPLRQVPDAISQDNLLSVTRILQQALRTQFGLSRPRIAMTGLNPHAGEAGYLGREEIDVIKPVLAALQAEGIDVQGPFPADTVFTPHHLNDFDCVLAMYHDQGLSVVKYAGFGQVVNITLGLPYIRTSVDHGTAYAIAGTQHVDNRSMHSAIKQAQEMATHE